MLPPLPASRRHYQLGREFWDYYGHKTSRTRKTPREKIAAAFFWLIHNAIISAWARMDNVGWRIGMDYGYTGSTNYALSARCGFIANRAKKSPLKRSFPVSSPPTLNIWLFVNATNDTVATNVNYRFVVNFIICSVQYIYFLSLFVLDAAFFILWNTLIWHDQTIFKLSIKILTDLPLSVCIKNRDLKPKIVKVYRKTKYFSVGDDEKVTLMSYKCFRYTVLK